MSDADIDALARRLQASARQVARPERAVPPAPGDFYPDLRVMAFDASLGNVGWMDLVVLASSICLWDKGTIRVETEEKGFLGTWERARLLNLALHGYGWMMARSDHVVVESPSVGGGHRTESSLIAGLQVYQMAPAKTHVVSAQHVAWVLTGSARYEDGTARKQAVKRALAQLVPGSDSPRWGNEHERDALAAGLTHLWDLSQAPETIDLVTATPEGTS